mmetsp:Transcript_8962/g.16909  ORF Transcript_8962/g.16909 Transcript_8962/m.16909 type:complete len:125 (-) Transcript_8962:1226-1600(-)
MKERNFFGCFVCVFFVTNSRKLSRSKNTIYSLEPCKRFGLNGWKSNTQRLRMCNQSTNIMNKREGIPPLVYKTISFRVCKAMVTNSFHSRHGNFFSTRVNHVSLNRFLSLAARAQHNRQWPNLQ